MSHTPARLRGFSLVELMVAMVLGIVIIGGCLTIFTGVVRSSSVNQTLSNLQGKARFALDLIGRDVRAAGFIGCASQRNVALSIGVSNPPTNDLASSAVSGYVVGSSWSPALPTGYTAPTGVGAPVSGTHALSVQYAEYPGLVLDTTMGSAGGAIVFRRDDNIVLRTGQLMVMSDCIAADLFAVNSIARAATTLTVTPDAVLSKVYRVPAAFPENTRGLPFVSTIYYIGDTQRTTESGDAVYALYAHQYPYTSANPPVELVEGADQLVLEFGVRQSDGSLLYAIASDTEYRAEGVETVRVGLLLSSFDRYTNVDANREYVLAGQSISARSASATTTSSGLTYISDQRMRMPFNATFNVRNRNE